MTEPLAADFPPVPDDEWRAAALKAAKLAEDAPTTSTTEDGIEVQWLYTADDALAPDPGGVPGRAPFVRGTLSGTGEDEPAWEIRQEQTHPERRAANAAILEDLEGGASAITVRLDRAARGGHAPGNDAFAATRGRDGVMVSTVDDLDAVLDGVHLDLAPVAVDAGAQAVPAAALTLALLGRRGTAPADARASLRVDPLGALAADGPLALDPADAVAAAGRFAAEVAAEYPAVRTLAVDTRAHVNAGATPVRELAVAITTGVAYLRAAEEAGLEPARAAAQLEFTLTVGTDQFGEIAKLRAFRRLWARVLELSGVPEEERRSVLVARTSDRMLAGIDPWTNMLRATTAGFAAAVGGADGLTVAPFDTVVADAVGAAAPSGLGRRIARNTQLVLQEESGLRRVADPAGGSWYVEQLTDALARAAWERITQIEGAGGAVAALTGADWDAELAGAADRRAGELARRKREMTGVNVFPLLDDDRVHPEPADRQALVQAEVDRLAERGALTGGAAGAQETDGGAGSGDAAAADGAATLPAETGPLLHRLLLAAEAGARIDGLAVLAGTGPLVDPDARGLPVRRDAEPFERLRAAAAGEPADTAADVAPTTDGSAGGPPTGAPSGGRADDDVATADGVDETAVRPTEVTADGPRVFLAGLGPLAAHAAQATWAVNFFGVGGLATVQSDPIEDPATAGELLKADGARLAAVAGGRTAEDDALRTAISSLRDAGAQTIYLVGGNDAKATELGADRGVKQGVDLLEILTDALATLDRPVTPRTETAR
ncbi:methylmalonyl-CoA mutase family protein [Patulibacter americanus]|uniref:methylmalonyl-CoA mutase family protein n=1 Tax=Patulibacter americanus TaxID=588672 RepID=UPI0003B46B6D|nr:methylmalonyl-CoA mutase family protein [Patulibacter americanus]